MIRARLSLILALSLLCAQLFLAWHGPSHIDPHSDPHQQALLVADCDACAHGNGLVALPVAGLVITSPDAPFRGDNQPQTRVIPTPSIAAQARAPPVAS